MEIDKSQVIDMVKNEEGVYVIDENITRENPFDHFYQKVDFNKKKTFAEEAIGEGILGRLYKFLNSDIIFGENRSSDVSEVDKKRYG